MWTTLLFIPFILTGFVVIGYANVMRNYID